METGYYKEVIVVVSGMNASSYCYFAGERAILNLLTSCTNSGVVVWNKHVSAPGSLETNVSFSQLYS